MNKPNSVAKKQKNLKFKLNLNKSKKRNVAKSPTSVAKFVKTVQSSAPVTTANIKEENEDSDELLFPLPNDTLLAIQSLIQRNCGAYCTPMSPSSVSTSFYPFIFRNMIDQVLFDQNQQSGLLNICQDLTELQETNQIRLIHLMNSKDVAIMETFYFENAIEDAICVGVQQSQLDSLLKQQEYKRVYLDLMQNFKSTGFEKSALEKILYNKTSFYLNTFCKLQLLQTSNSNYYYFTLPTIGKALQDIEKGHKTLLRKLEWSMQGELSQKVLLQSNFSDIPPGFLIRDALSKGLLRTFTTPSGEIFIRLVHWKRKNKVTKK